MYGAVHQWLLHINDNNPEIGVFATLGLSLILSNNNLDGEIWFLYKLLTYR
jgi:hypothetical protein